MDVEFDKIEAINSKNLGFTAKEIRKRVEDQGKAVFLYRVGGVVADYYTGETEKGEWIGFRGQFVAMSADGRNVQSAVAYLPAQVAKKLREELEAGVVEIEMKADIFAIETDKNASGYAYMSEPIMSRAGREKLAKVRNLLLEDELPISLAAPSKAPALEDQSDGETADAEPATTTAKRR